MPALVADGRDIGERSDAVLRTAMPGHDAECVEGTNSNIGLLKRQTTKGPALSPALSFPKCLFRGQDPARAFSMKSVRSAFFQSGIAETFFSWISASVCLVR